MVGNKAFCEFVVCTTKVNSYNFVLIKKLNSTLVEMFASNSHLLSGH